MSAQDNISEQLFHGSGEVFKSGDVIKPQNYSVAYSTTDPNYAYHFANEGNFRPAKKTKNWQMPLFSMVYQVEPVDHEEMKSSTEQWNKDVAEPEDSDIRVSKKGFRVKGVHSFVPKDERRY